MNAAVSLIERVLPATVHVQTEIPSDHPSARLLGTERMGSGAIIDENGLILTVNYVVLGASEVRVTLLDQREYVAEVVRHDFTSGLGLLRIAETKLTALPLCRSTELNLGDEIFEVASAGEGQARISNGAVSYLGPFDANWEYVLERAIMPSSIATNSPSGGSRSGSDTRAPKWSGMLPGSRPRRRARVRSPAGCSMRRRRRFWRPARPSRKRAGV